MIEHHGDNYSNSRIPLDGHKYIKCTFEGCTFVYGATGDIGLEGNTITDDCRFEFVGAAAATLDAMRGIYLMGPWGEQMIAQTFKDIAPPEGLKAH